MDDIVVKGLSKSFKIKGKKVHAVRDVSFSVRKGEIFGLLGVNGAGKTTTINMLTGLLEKDKGSISILGKDPQSNWEYVKNAMNVSTAYYPLSDVLTIRQNLRIYAKIYGIKDVEEKINELLKLFELSRLADRKVIGLSSGEKTRTALCKGLINEPRVLFLDECTVGLDPDIAEKTRRVISNYQKRTGSSILFTSHYMAEVEELCDRIAFMEEGKILTISTAEELKATIKRNTVEVAVKKGATHLVHLLKQKAVDVRINGNVYVFDVEGENEMTYRLLKEMFAAGVEIEDLHIKAPTLDDIFIRFARGVA